jgi:hypothetical protein
MAEYAANRGGCCRMDYLKLINFVFKNNVKMYIISYLISIFAEIQCTDFMK